MRNEQNRCIYLRNGTCWHPTRPTRGDRCQWANVETMPYVTEGSMCLSGRVRE